MLYICLAILGAISEEHQSKDLASTRLGVSLMLHFRWCKKLTLLQSFSRYRHSGVLTASVLCQPWSNAINSSSKN